MTALPSDKRFSVLARSVMDNCPSIVVLSRRRPFLEVWPRSIVAIVLKTAMRSLNRGWTLTGLA
jgi:hypothetical protein